jgi:cytochrome P450
VSALSRIIDRDPDLVRCPYPAYDELRGQGPVIFDEEAGFFVVTGYEQAQYVASHPELFSSANPMGPSVIPAARAIEDALAGDPELAARVGAMNSNRGVVLFTADPPRHTRHRKLLNRALTPRALAALEPDIRALCLATVETFADRRRVEFISEYASVISALTLGILLGVPSEETSQFLRWGQAINSSIGSTMAPDQIRSCVADQLEFMDYFWSKIEARRAQPTADMLSAVANARSETEEPFSVTEVMGIVSQLVSAGVETTTKLIGCAMRFLCDRPDVQELYAESPERIPDFLEECLRLEAPIQGLFRIATRDTVVDQQSIPRGAMIWVVWGAANRDDRIFECPADLNSSRHNLRSHMSFGHGIHFCIGAPLARLEARIALESVLSRLQAIQLDTRDAIAYEANYMIHGISRLPLTFSARNQ